MIGSIQASQNMRYEAILRSEQKINARLSGSLGEMTRKQEAFWSVYVVNMRARAICMHVQHTASRTEVIKYTECIYIMKNAHEFEALARDVTKHWIY